MVGWIGRTFCHKKRRGRRDNRCTRAGHSKPETYKRKLYYLLLSSTLVVGLERESLTLR